MFKANNKVWTRQFSWHQSKSGLKMRDANFCQKHSELSRSWDHLHPFMARSLCFLKHLLNRKKREGSSGSLISTDFKDQILHCNSGNNTELRAENFLGSIFLEQGVPTEQPNQNMSLTFSFLPKYFVTERINIIFYSWLLLAFYKYIFLCNFKPTIEQRLSSSVMLITASEM